MKIINAKEIDQTTVPFEADICIVGTGPSGYTLAKRLSGSGLHVVVLESGGLKFSHKAQSLSRGAIVGVPYEPLHICRVRRLGGSTGRRGWGAWCKTLWPEDFETRTFIPDSGWPVTFDEMVPYYRRAFETCGFTGLDSERWFDKPLKPNQDVAVENAFLAPLKDFSQGWAKLREEDPKNLTLIYNATVTELLTETTENVVSSVEVSNGSNTFRVTPKVLVLATGGIENARLLLLSDRTHTKGIGNGNDLVGRYFMEHPRFRWGHITTTGNPDDVLSLDPSDINRNGTEFPADLEMRLAKGLVVSRQRRELEGLLASRTWLQPVPQGGEGDGARTLREMGFWVAKGRRPPHLGRSMSRIVRHPIDASKALYFYKGPASRRLQTRHFCFNSIFEQAPHRDSRVTLSRRTDPLKRRKVSLDWRIDPLTWHTVSRTQAILAEHFKRQGHRVAFDDWKANSNSPPNPSWVRHHMGTTRMNDSPSQGVVDRQCRVHGMENLFIAGTSVFPTGGNDMITLTAIALAHRLADRIHQVLPAG